MGYIYEKIHSFYLKHDSLCMIYELAHIVGFMIRYGCYAPTRFLVDDSRRLMFFVNPKVASSSIKASIYEGGGGYRKMVHQSIAL